MSPGSDFSFAGADGVALHVHNWPADSPRAAVLIAHGMAEHGARYRRLAQALNAAGLSVIAPDLRGHGMSVPAGEAPGHLADADGFRKCVDDLMAIADDMAAAVQGRPLILLGHSMGSFMAQAILGRGAAPFAGVALSGTNGPPPKLAAVGRVIARIERLRLGRRGLSRLIDGLSFSAFNKPFEPAQTAFDWLSRDRAVCENYVADPLCGFVCSVQTWIDLLDALPGLTRTAALAAPPRALPILLLSGDKDPVGEFGHGVRRLARAYGDAGLVNVRVKLYPGGRHEMFNETNHAEVTADFVEWCDGVIDSIG